MLLLVLYIWARGGVLEDVLGLEDTFWSPWPWPRGLKSSKIALSSVRGQHFFLYRWNFADRVKNNFRRLFLLENAWKNFWRPFSLFFFCFLRSPEKNFWRPIFRGEHLRLCPWFLALASSIPVLGLERVCPRRGCPWPWPRMFFVSLASSLVSSTPPLIWTYHEKLIGGHKSVNR